MNEEDDVLPQIRSPMGISPKRSNRIHTARNRANSVPIKPDVSHLKTRKRRGFAGIGGILSRGRRGNKISKKDRRSLNIRNDRPSTDARNSTSYRAVKFDGHIKSERVRPLTENAVDKEKEKAEKDKRRKRKKRRKRGSRLSSGKFTKSPSRDRKRSRAADSPQYDLKRSSKIRLYGRDDEKLVCVKIFPPKDFIARYDEESAFIEKRRQEFYERQEREEQDSVSQSSSRSSKSPARTPKRRSYPETLDVNGVVVDPRTRRKSSTSNNSRRSSRGSRSRSRSPSNSKALSHRDRTPDEFGVYTDRSYGMDCKFSYSLGKDEPYRDVVPNFVAEHKYFYAIIPMKISPETKYNSENRLRFFWKINNRSFVVLGPKVLKQSSTDKPKAKKRKHAKSPRKEVSTTDVEEAEMINQTYVSKKNIIPTGEIVKRRRKLIAYGRNRTSWRTTLDKLAEVPRVMEYQFTNHDKMSTISGKEGLCRHMYFCELDFLPNIVGSGCTQQFHKTSSTTGCTVFTTIVVLSPKNKTVGSDSSGDLEVDQN